jgi:hypothetical protein
MQATGLHERPTFALMPPGPQLHGAGRLSIDHRARRRLLAG